MSRTQLKPSNLEGCKHRAKNLKIRGRYLSRPGRWSRLWLAAGWRWPSSAGRSTPACCLLPLPTGCSGHQLTKQHLAPTHTHIHTVNRHARCCKPPLNICPHTLPSTVTPTGHPLLSPAFLFLFLTQSSYCSVTDFFFVVVPSFPLLTSATANPGCATHNGYLLTSPHSLPLHTSSLTSSHPSDLQRRGC